MHNNNTTIENRILFGQKQIFTERTLRITGTIVVEGALQLKDCFVDLSQGRLEVSGTLFMDSCVLENPGQDALHLDTGAYAIIRNTKVLFRGSHSFTASMLYQQTGSWVSLERCTFENEGDFTHSGISSLIHIPYGKADNCTFHRFRVDRFLSAHEILGCSFDNCGLIYCGEWEDEGIIADCTFNYCVSVRADNSTVKDSRFLQLTEDLCVEQTEVEGCLFEDITCGCEALVYMVDSTVSHCDFRNIHVEEDSLLVSAIDSGSVEHCSFDCISSNREDEVLFSGSKLSGGIYKRRRSFDILDEETCTGLDDVRFV